MKNIPTVLRRKTKSANFYQFCQVGPVPAGGPRRRLRRPRRDAGVDPAAALRRGARPAGRGAGAAAALQLARRYSGMNLWSITTK